MAWIEVHQTLPRHPKLVRLAARLGIKRVEVVGHLVSLWLWCIDYAPDGNLSQLGSAELAAAADFEGDAELFSRHLRESGWIDANGKIHDWLDYAGRLMVKREQSKDRMRTFRERARELQLVARNERVTNCNVTCTFAPVATDLTGPNQTLPDPTSPNQTDSSSPHESIAPIPKITKRMEKGRATLALINELRGGKHFLEVKSNLIPIAARLEEPGVEVNEVFKMLRRHWEKVKGTKWADYFTPESMFRPSNFPGLYANREMPVIDENIKSVPWQRKEIQENIPLKML